MSKMNPDLKPQPVTKRELQPRPYKVQKPLMHSGPFEYLIYDRSRKTQYHFPGPVKEIESLMGALPKIYILANFTHDMRIVIHHVLPPQDF